MLPLTMRRSERLSADRGDVLLDGLVRIGAYLAVVALLCFELVAVGANLVQLDELAGDIARQAAGAVHDVRNARAWQATADAEVLRAVTEHGDVQVGPVTVDRGGAVSVTLVRAPRTMLVHRLGPLSRHLPQSMTATGRPASM